MHCPLRRTGVGFFLNFPGLAQTIEMGGGSAPYETLESCTKREDYIAQGSAIALVCSQIVYLLLQVPT